MSKITNDGFTRSGTECCTHMATVGVKGLILLDVDSWQDSVCICITSLLHLVRGTL